MTTANQTGAKGNRFRDLIAHEMYEYFLNFAFLATFLIVFAWYKRLVLASYHIHYQSFWLPLISAAILAKVIMVGEALHIGKRLRVRPLALVTLYRTFLFSLLTILFIFAEHVIEAIIHGKGAGEGIAEIANKGIDEILAQCVLILTAFVPFFALKEIERVFGAEKLRNLFFRGEPETTETPSSL